MKNETKLKYKINLNCFARKAKKYSIGNDSTIISPMEPFETDFLIDGTDIKRYADSLHADMYIKIYSSLKLFSRSR